MEDMEIEKESVYYMKNNFDFNFYMGKRVMITGHTGFKGSWLTKILLNMGADVLGYALDVPEESLYYISGYAKDIRSIIGDIRDYNFLKKVFDSFKPEIVIHLAAQPLVRESYRNPVYTYETNVMGTVNLLECIRNSGCVRSVLNVTTDKVYKNREWCWGYRENEELDGYDPYSNSKSCSELVTHSYIQSFFQDKSGKILLPVSTARAGNVIGGGDFAEDRIIPDCIRAMRKDEDIIVRNPYSIRPYQHVLEPLCAYLLIAGMQYKNPELAGNYNVGPDEGDCCETGKLVELFLKYWKGNRTWINQYSGDLHEAHYLKLDCSKIKTDFGWKPKWGIDMAVNKTVEWTKEWMENRNVNVCMDKQIKEYFAD